MMKRNLPLLFLLTASLNIITASKLFADEAVKTDYPMIANAYEKVIFKEGDGGSKYFRIPAICTAMNGDLIAVIDARRNTTTDMQYTGNIDIAIKRSSDNGQTWTDTSFITDFPSGEVGSDPALIVDRITGEIFCFYNYLNHNSEFNKKARAKNRRNVDYRHYVQSSKDNGKTWSKPKDIRPEIMPDEVGPTDFVFITSGRGIQTKSGALVHTIVNVGKAGYIFGSKDHGKTWSAFKNHTPFKPANECKVLELSDGSWCINARHNGGKFRYLHHSKDKGVSWTGAKDLNLPDPGCNAEPIVYTSKSEGYQKNRLLFVNACSQKGRKNLVLSISYDDGKTWAHRKCIEKGPAQYSALTICKNGDIGIFYERITSENKKRKTDMVFTRVTLKDLTDSTDKLSIPFKLK